MHNHSTVTPQSQVDQQEVAEQPAVSCEIAAASSDADLLNGHSMATLEIPERRHGDQLVDAISPYLKDQVIGVGPFVSCAQGDTLVCSTDCEGGVSLSRYTGQRFLLRVPASSLSKLGWQHWVKSTRAVEYKPVTKDSQ
jgi:hypothetical protein